MQTKVGKAIEAVKKLCVSNEAKWQITVMDDPIALRILSWARYYQDVFGLSENNSIGFLNDTLFTEEGIIDTKKVAEEIIEKLVNDQNLHINIRNKLACTYCLKKWVNKLWTQGLEKENLSKQPELVKFWTYSLTGHIDELKGEKSVHRYGFEAAIKDGSEVAVKHFWSKLTINERKKIVDFAMQVLKHKLESEDGHDGQIPLDIVNNNNSRSLWFPVEYYNDILIFLLSQMKEEQKIEFFERDVKAANYSLALDCFLEWPYQHYFIEAAKLIGKSLSGSNYAMLLENITDRFTNKGYYIEIGGNDYYRKLFKEFWSQSSDKYKRYILCDEPDHETLNDLFSKLFETESLTSSINEENVELLKLILKNVTRKEKESIISFSEWEVLCNKLIMEGKWESLEEVLGMCTSSEEQLIQFKKEFSYYRDVPFCLVRQGKLSLLDEFEKWSTRSKEETNIHKRTIIFSLEGKKICFDYILEDELKFADEFVRWSLISEEEIKEFKKEFVGIYGYIICEILISEIEIEHVCDEQSCYAIGHKINFTGGKWKQVEMFLAWAFSSEEEVREFKICVLEFSGITILYRLIDAKRWKDAEMFFALLNLSKEAVKELKKKTIRLQMEVINSWTYREAIEHIDYVRCRWKEIDSSLRWYLTDKEAVLEFKDEFDKLYGFKNEKKKLLKKEKSF